MSEDLQREERLFSEALALEGAAERHAFLERAAGEDAGLRERVRRLLEAADRSGRYFDRAERTAPNRGMLLEAGEQVGDRIGRYKLLEQIGEGGFGTVYVAEQDEPIRRKVALKIIKLGMDTRQVIARFEVERQALALMEHPNIAKVFDAGATETGRPYFVMELVRGVPLTRFCDENRLSPTQRLQLFIEVCDAVQHAHQKGIIHRDLKPSNILVTMNGRRAVPKVIDFGIAKATQERLTDKTLYTRFHQFMGTPEYISPEQAEMSEVPVDTRSDIYSLGVLLYELLVGRPPFAASELLKAGFDQMRRILREAEPLRPSRQLSRLDRAALTTTAARHRCAPQQLLAWLQGDLEHVILKAIEKDVDRRYASAAALAEDIQRFLKQEPVTAVPLSRRYRLAKFVRRHQFGVGAGVAVALAIILGASLAVWQAVRATGAERLAKQRLAIAEEARNAAGQAKARAEEAHVRAEAEAAEALRQAAENQAVNAWLLQDLLSTADNFELAGMVSRRGAEVTLREAILLASGTLEDRFRDHPAIEAQVRQVLGRSLALLGDVEAGIKNWRRAYTLSREHLGRGHTNTLVAQFGLGWDLAFHFNPKSGNESERALGEEGRRLMEESHALSEELFGPENEGTLSRAFNLGVHYNNTGDTRLAAPLVTRAWDVVQRMGRTNRTVSFQVQQAALNSMYVLRDRQGRAGEAYRFAEQLAQLVRQRPKTSWSPEDDYFTARLDLDLGRLYLTFDRDYEKAEPRLRKGLDIARRTCGDGILTQDFLHVLANLCQDRGRPLEALTLMRECLDLSVRTLGTNHSLTRLTVREVAAVPARVGQWPEVVREFQSQRERGIVDSRLLAKEMLARHLNREPEFSPTLRKALWQQVADKPGESANYQTALVLLVLPCPEAEHSQVLQLAQAASASAGASSWSDEQNRLLQGLAAFHRGRFSEALDLLEPVAHNVNNRRMAALARFYVAMARHRQGDEVDARAAVDQANDLLTRLLCAGDLALPHPPDGWGTLALALVARDTAEASIPGEHVSKAVTEESLAAARSSWKAVHDLLEAMEEAARRQDYADAHRLYRKARQHPSFEWEAALQDIAWLNQRVAPILIQAEAQDDYVSFLKDIFREDTTLPPGFLWVGTIGTAELPLELRSRIQAGASAYLRDDQRREAMEAKPDYYWHMHHVGIALYRLGRSEEALDCLKAGMESHRHDCSLSSTAYAALAAWKLGQTKEAMHWRNEAEDGLRVRVEAGAGKLDPNWWHLSVTDLALKEARRLMEHEPVRAAGDRPPAEGPPAAHRVTAETGTSQGSPK